MSGPSGGHGRGFGHGKVILLGEHAVVYGQPALATGLRAGVTAWARRGSGRLCVPTWKLEARATDDTQAGRAFAALLAALGAAEVDVEAKADIPAQAGLGSSAALAVAAARAVASLLGLPDERVVAAVAASESIFHGNASGIDAAAAASGGVGLFKRSQGWRPIGVGRPFRLCVGLSGESRDTAMQVAMVRRRLQEIPEARALIASLGQIAEAGARAVTSGSLLALGPLMTGAHEVLVSLGVSSRGLDALCATALDAGAQGAKLTGAGGGGAVIALAGDSETAVLERWRREGFVCFVTDVPGAADAAPAPGARAGATSGGAA